jgi:hypothetical protein
MTLQSPARLLTGRREAGTAGLGMWAIALVLTRPRLWRATLAFVPARWWRRWPPLPLPDRRYLAFRSETMFGSGGGRLEKQDLLDYLEWCRRLGSRSR